MQQRKEDGRRDEGEKLSDRPFNSLSTAKAVERSKNTIDNVTVTAKPRTFLFPDWTVPVAAFAAPSPENVIPMLEEQRPLALVDIGQQAGVEHDRTKRLAEPPS